MSGFGEGLIFGCSMTGRLMTFSYGVMFHMTVAGSVLLSVVSVFSETSAEEMMSMGAVSFELLEILSVNC